MNKNIHILPTDKPSRLGRFIDTNNLVLKTFYELSQSSLNIFITSDEEIKDGDWFYNPFINEIQINCNPDGCKKIILTTDQDLIKDDVQAIDDEFLVWFVNNPSCESVQYVGDDCYYEIIIPQEEPKQIKCYCGHTITCDCEPLQETFEEAAEMYIQSKNPQWTLYHKQSFKDGAKWKQEQDKNNYSEEDMINFAHFYFKEEFNSTMQTNKSTKELLSEWFEQNKNK
jgi:hypothetical protein